MSAQGRVRTTTCYHIAPHLVFAFSHAGRSVGVDLFLYYWLAKDPIGQTGIERFLRYWV